MRRLLASAVVWSVASASPSWADDAAVKAVIDRAVKAMGGEEALKKAGSFSLTYRIAKLDEQGRIVESLWRVVSRGKRHARYEKVSDGRQPGLDPPTVVVTIDGDSLVQKWDGQPAVLFTGPTMANWVSYHAMLLATVYLAPFRDGASRVEAGPVENVAGAPARPLRVAGRGGVTLCVWFDEATGLPVRTLRPRDGLDPKAPETHDAHVYREFGGLTLAETRSGVAEGGAEPTKTWATAVVDFKALDEVDPKTFAKPE